VRPRDEEEKPMTTHVPTWELRARFALGLAEMYGGEVPAYNTLVEVSRAVNDDVAAVRGQDAERLGSIERVTAERHGAIRVGSPGELAGAARVFAAFGMHPVGFYDLRDASSSSVPVVSTAFRPVDAEELARNPFRVFTSMLTTDDRRFFDPPTQQRLEAFLAGRTYSATTCLPWPTGRQPRAGCRSPRPRNCCAWRPRPSGCPTSPSTRTGTATWSASRRWRPTSVACPPRTSTTSRPVCSTSTSCTGACRPAASR
jgi:hypothetical protein